MREISPRSSRHAASTFLRAENLPFTPCFFDTDTSFDYGARAPNGVSKKMVGRGTPVLRIRCSVRCRRQSPNNRSRFACSHPEQALYRFRSLCGIAGMVASACTVRVQTEETMTATMRDHAAEYHPGCGSRRYRGLWLQCEADAVAGADQGEMTAICGEDLADLQSLRDRHERGIYEPEAGVLILFHDF